MTTNISLIAASDEASDLRVALANLTDAFLARHGCFPLDRTTDAERHWCAAMAEAYRLIGQPGSSHRAAEMERSRSKPSVRRVRHRSRGSTYEVLGEAEAQVTTYADGTQVPLGRVRSRLLTEGDKLIVYRCEQTQKLWLRFPDEFEDGRFEEVDRG